MKNLFPIAFLGLMVSHAHSMLSFDAKVILLQKAKSRIAPEKIHSWKTAAAKGDPWANYMLGKYYLEVEKSYDKGYPYLQEAAKTLQDAQSYKGKLLRVGYFYSAQKVWPQLKEALSFYKSISNFGIQEAKHYVQKLSQLPMDQMGLKYENCLLTPLTEEPLKGWAPYTRIKYELGSSDNTPLQVILHQVADQGDIGALILCARLAARPSEAEAFLHKAANQTSEDPLICKKIGKAQHHLGHFHWGHGNFEKSFHWWEMAAQNGYPGAKRLLMQKAYEAILSLLAYRHLPTQLDETVFQTGFLSPEFLQDYPNDPTAQKWLSGVRLFRTICLQGHSMFELESALSLVINKEEAAFYDLEEEENPFQPILLEDCDQIREAGNHGSKDALFLINALRLRDTRSAFQASINLEILFQQGWEEAGVILGHKAQNDLPKALEWYRRAAEQGNSEAMVCLWQHLKNNEGVLWIDKAIDLNHPHAAIHRFLDIAQATGHAAFRLDLKGDQSALKKHCLIQGFGVGHPVAIYILGLFHTYGLTHTIHVQLTDVYQHWPHYQDAAKEAHNKICYEWGHTLLRGKSAEDRAKGEAYLLKAVHYEHLESMGSLGEWYVFGGQQRKAGWELITKAAHRGSVMACYLAGSDRIQRELYGPNSSVNHIDITLEQAIQFIRNALSATKTHPKLQLAYLDLGEYSFRKGRPYYAEAREAFSHPWIADHPHTLMRLGQIYIEENQNAQGIGVESALRAGYDYLEQAKTKAYMPAYVVHGIYYAKKQDVEAIQLFNQAIAMGWELPDLNWKKADHYDPEKRAYQWLNYKKMKKAYIKLAHKNLFLIYFHEKAGDKMVKNSAQYLRFEEGVVSYELFPELSQQSAFVHIELPGVTDRDQPFFDSISQKYQEKCNQLQVFEGDRFEDLNNKLQLLKDLIRDLHANWGQLVNSCDQSAGIRLYLRDQGWTQELPLGLKVEMKKLPYPQKEGRK